MDEAYGKILKYQQTIRVRMDTPRMYLSGTYCRRDGNCDCGGTRARRNRARGGRLHIQSSSTRRRGGGSRCSTAGNGRGRRRSRRRGCRSTTRPLGITNKYVSADLNKQYCGTAHPAEDLLQQLGVDSRSCNDTITVHGKGNRIRDIQQPDTSKTYTLDQRRRENIGG